MNPTGLPPVNLNISSTRADGYISEIELEIGRAFGVKDDRAAGKHLKRLAETRPLAAIVQCQREVVARGGDREAECLIDVRSELIENHFLLSPIAGSVAAAMCWASSAEGTLAQSTATSQVAHLMTDFQKYNNGTVETQTFAHLLVTCNLNKEEITVEIEQPRKNSSGQRIEATERLASFLFSLAPAPSRAEQRTINRMEIASTALKNQYHAAANEVIAVFFGQEDGPEHVQARRILSGLSRPGADFAGAKPRAASSAASPA